MLGHLLLAARWSGWQGDDVGDVPGHSQDDEMHGVLDLRSMALEVVLSTDDSVLNNAVRRVVRDLGSDNEQYSAHGTSVVT